MSTQQKKVIVVGGGTAGWLTAASIKAAFPAEVSVTLIEPKGGNRIGVGESTLPTILGTLKRLGCLNQDFLREVDATFKQGIRFEDWSEIGKHFYHPYDYRTAAKYHRLARWLQSDHGASFAATSTLQVQALDEGLSPFSSEGGKLAPHYRYSLHVDAEKLAEAIKSRWARTNGVELLHGKLAHCHFRGDDLHAITLTSGKTLTADLFVDCTGQRRLLAGPKQVLRKYDFLPVDRALASRPAYFDDARPSYTLARATRAGWIWDIPLAKRRGVGVVFNSAHMTDEQANDILASHIGAAAADARLISFESGVLAQPWTGNVISIGLSAGFIEPLESTGIYFIEEAVNLLLAYFPLGEVNHSRRQFNTLLTERYDECADFVFLHYHLSQRRDTDFWRSVTSKGRAPKHISEQLEFWSHMPPCAEQFQRVRQVFGDVAYEYVLYGMGWRPSKDITELIGKMSLPPASNRQPFKLATNAEVNRLLNSSTITMQR